jgi:ABC-2 type transport system ATP-binding protein
MSLQVNDISKNYGPQLAVSPLSFQIQAGEVVGFLGPNGAGKSTTLKMLSGYLLPDQGTISIQGISLASDPIAYKHKIGYLPESNALYEDLYVKEYFTFLAQVHKIENKNERIKALIQETGLGDMQHKKIGELSKGYKQRVGIAAAIIHQPALILLDEPTSGLDPNQLIEIRALIKSLSANAMILFSTHILQEVTAICSRVMVMHHSSLVADKPIDQLLQSAGSKIVVNFEEDINFIVKDEFWDKGVMYLQDKHTLVVTASNVSEAKKNVMNFALAKGLNIQALQTQETSLEEIFKLLTH